MPIVWIPDGSLDVATSPSNLPQEANGRTIISHALARSKNLELVNEGETKLRRGSARVSSTKLDNVALKIVVQDGIRYIFTHGNIYKNETSIFLQSASSWDAVLYNAFNDITQQIYAISGTTKKRIEDDQVSDWGLTAPTVAPTLAVGALTGLTGDYNAIYTYARLVDETVVAESNPSPAADAAVTLADESLDITWTASTDSQVTHVRIYRTLTGGTIYFFDQNIAIGTTTLDSDTADTALGGQVETDNDPPPNGRLLGGPFYNGVLFLIDANLLYYCKPKRPESWPSTNFVEVGNKQTPLTCLTEFSGQPYVLNKGRIWFIQGTGSNTFFPVPLETMTGAQGQFGALGVEGHGIFHTGPDGIYLFGGGRDRKFSESKYDPIFRGEDRNGIPGVCDIASAWMSQLGNRLFFHYDVGNVIVFNVDSGKSYYYQYDMGLHAPYMDEQRGELYAGDDAFYIRLLERGNTDNGGAISWEGQSKDFTLQTRAHFPRWVKYDTEGTMTGSVVLDDVVQQTHAITEDRNTRRRLINVENGKRCALRLNGTGPGTIYVVEME